MRFTYFRGLSQVSKWVRLKFAAMNLKKYAMHRRNRGVFTCFFAAFDRYWLFAAWFNPISVEDMGFWDRLTTTKVVVCSAPKRGYYWLTLSKRVLNYYHCITCTATRKRVIYLSVKVCVNPLVCFYFLASPYVSLRETLMLKLFYSPGRTGGFVTLKHTTKTDKAPLPCLLYIINANSPRSAQFFIKILSTLIMCF